MVDLEKPRGIISEVHLTERNSDEPIGIARIERTRGYAILYHIDASEMPPEILHRGFSFGKHNIPGEGSLRLPAG